MTAATPTAAELSFAWEPSSHPAFGWACRIVATEPRKRVPDKVTVTDYRVEELPRVPEGRAFLFAKAPDFDGPRADEVYECFVGRAGLHACTCSGSQCRRHGIRCRHVQAVDALLDGEADRASRHARDHAAREAELPECFRGLGCPPSPQVPF
jgi:hypothetical protein